MVQLMHQLRRDAIRAKRPPTMTIARHHPVPLCRQFTTTPQSGGKPCLPIGLIGLYTYYYSYNAWKIGIYPSNRTISGHRAIGFALLCDDSRLSRRSIQVVSPSK